MSKLLVLQAILKSFKSLNRPWSNPPYEPEIFSAFKSVDTALHCLPADFIAGKMMLVRAMILGLSLDIVKPTAEPMKDVYSAYDFVAMTPMQAPP